MCLAHLLDIVDEKFTKRVPSNLSRFVIHGGTHICSGALNCQDTNHAGLVPWKQRPRVVSFPIALAAVVVEQHMSSVIPLRVEHTPARRQRG